MQVLGILLLGCNITTTFEDGMTVRSSVVAHCASALRNGDLGFSLFDRKMCRAQLCTQI